MKDECLGAGRLSRKPCPVRRFERIGGTSGAKTSCFTKILRNLRAQRRCFDAENERKPRGVCETDPPQTSSGAVFAEGGAPKSQTALGNRWPGAATSDQELNANIKPRFRPALCEGEREQHHQQKQQNQPEVLYLACLSSRCKRQDEPQVSYLAVLFNPEIVCLCGVAVCTFAALVEPSLILI